MQNWFLPQGLVLKYWRKNIAILMKWNTLLVNIKFYCNNLYSNIEHKLFVKIGNSLVIHPSYVGDSLDRKQNPTKLDKTSSNEMKSQMEACRSMFLYFWPASQFYLIFLTISRKNNTRNWRNRLTKTWPWIQTMISTTNETLMKIQAVMAPPKWFQKERNEELLAYEKGSFCCN